MKNEKVPSSHEKHKIGKFRAPFFGPYQRMHIYSFQGTIQLIGFKTLG